jgi:hypothetical protein
VALIPLYLLASDKQTINRKRKMNTKKIDAKVVRVVVTNLTNDYACGRFVYLTDAPMRENVSKVNSKQISDAIKGTVISEFPQVQSFVEAGFVLITIYEVFDFVASGGWFVVFPEKLQTVFPQMLTVNNFQG